MSTRTVLGSSPRGRDRAEQGPPAGPSASPAGLEQSLRWLQMAWGRLGLVLVRHTEPLQHPEESRAHQALPRRRCFPTTQPGAISNRTVKHLHPQRPSHPSDEKDTRARCPGGDSPRARSGPGGAGHSPIDEVADDGALLGCIGGLPGHDDVVPVRVVAMHVHGCTRGPGDQGVSVCGEGRGQRPMVSVWGVRGQWPGVSIWGGRGQGPGSASQRERTGTRDQHLGGGEGTGTRGSASGGRGEERGQGLGAAEALTAPQT